MESVNFTFILHIDIMTSCVQVSWAPGIGIKKSAFKRLFDEEQGVTYIPWSKMPSSMESLAEGGMFDENSLPPQPATTTGDFIFQESVC